MLGVDTKAWGPADWAVFMFGAGFLARLAFHLGVWLIGLAGIALSYVYRMGK